MILNITDIYCFRRSIWKYLGGGKNVKNINVDKPKIL